jgi:hypothetical protein
MIQRLCCFEERRTVEHLVVSLKWKGVHSLGQLNEDSLRLCFWWAQLLRMFGAKENAGFRYTG